MAKRVIQECDLTKQEYDPDETVTLVFKKKGKSGRTYELSSSAATKLEQQLVAGKEAILPEDWQFSGVSRRAATATNSDGRRRRTLEDLETEEGQDDTKFVSKKKAELKEAGVIKDEERQEPAEQVISEALEAPKSKNNGCRHLNKGRIQTTLKGGKRFIYRKCVDCRTNVPEMTTETREAFMNGKTDPDVRARDLNT